MSTLFRSAMGTVDVRLSVVSALLGLCDYNVMRMAETKRGYDV